MPRARQTSKAHTGQAQRPPLAGTGQPQGPALAEEDRQRMIAEAAYYLAERRGFAGGNPTEDWLQAEQAVDRMLGRVH